MGWDSVHYTREGGGGSFMDESGMPWTWGQSVRFISGSTQCLRRRC